MSSKSMFIGLGVVAVVVIAAIGFYFSKPEALSTASNTALNQTAPASGEDTVAANDNDATAEEETVAENSTDPRPAVTADDLPAAPADALIDADAALAPRTLGDANAPVKVEEFASLSCSHCASFSEETFPAFKEKYIDTGKVHFTFTDFPLNASALDAAMIARCLPEERYFNFIKFLFENQNDWAFSSDHRQILQQNVSLLGMSTDGFNTCLANNDLRTGLITRMQEKSEAHQVRSTPSFVINGERVITGAQPLAAFEEIIDPLLAGEQTTEEE